MFSGEFRKVLGGTIKVFDFDAALFWYKLMFMGELVLAEGLAAYTLKKKRYFAVRVTLCLIGLFAVAFLCPIFYFNAAYSSLMFLLFFGVTLIALKICFEESLVNLLFCAIIAYTTQHIAYIVYNFILSVTGIGTFNVYGDETVQVFDVFTGLVYAGTYAIIYWFVWAFVEYRVRQQEDLKIGSIKLFVLSATIILIDIVLNAIVVYAAGERSELVLLSFYLANIINCALALGLQFYLLSNKMLEKEVQTVQSLWLRDKKMYEMSKENIELINIKCHDLRKQIRALHTSEGAVDKAALQEVENAVNMYDSAVKTGNKVLDVVLTEKSLYCEKNNIKLICLADGAKLDFISAWDLYSLFENAIQNAIEAVIKIGDAEKRLIRLKVVGINQFLSIHLENFFPDSEKVEFSGGLPKTTKDDKRYHGFGMRSMQLLAEKHGGGLKAYITGNLFNLDIMIPIKQPSGE